MFTLAGQKILKFDYVFMFFSIRWPNQGVLAWALPKDRAHHPRCGETEERNETNNKNDPITEKKWFVKGSFSTGFGGFPVTKNHPHQVCFNLSWVK